MRVSDKFDQSTCGVCGDCEINQYFAINENFIEYQGTFYSLREILSSALDFQVNSEFIVKNFKNIHEFHLRSASKMEQQQKYAWTARTNS